MVRSVVKKSDRYLRRFTLRMDDGSEVEVRIRFNPGFAPVDRDGAPPTNRWMATIHSKGREGIPGGVGATPAAAFYSATLPDGVLPADLTSTMIADAIDPYGAFALA